MESGLDNVLKRKYETRSSRNAIPMNAKLEQQSPQECDTQHNASRSSLTYGLNNDATTHENRARTTNNMRKTPLERSYMIIDKNSGTFVTETFDKKKIFPTASASSDAKETSQNDSDLNLKKYAGERRLKSNGGISAGSHTKQTSFSSVNDNDATTDGFPVVFGSQQQILALYQGTSSKSNKFRKNSNSFGSGQISSPHKSESSHAPYLDPFSLEQKAEKLFPFFNEDDTQSSTDNSEMEFDWHDDSLTSNRPTSWSDTPITERPLPEDDFQPDLNKTVKVTDIDSLFLAQNDSSKDLQDDGSNARETVNEIMENGEVKLSPEMGDLEDELALFSESLWEDMNDMEINSNSPQEYDYLEVEETITPVDSPRDNINVHDLFHEDCPNESIIVPVNKHKQVFQEFLVEESLSSTQAADDVGLSDMNQTTITFTQDDETDNKMTSQKVKSTTDDVISDKVNCSDRSTPSHGQCDVINTFDGKTIDGCHGDTITHDPYDYEESNVSSHSDTDVCSNVDVDVRSHKDFSGDVGAGSHGGVSVGNNGDVSVGSHSDVSVGGLGDVSVSSHGGVSVGSHGDVSVSSHGGVSVGNNGDVSVSSHGGVSVGSLGDVNIGCHGDVSAVSHGDVSVGSHGDVSVSSHGDVSVSSHGDASVGDVNVSSHDDVNVGSHGDVSVGSHGDASVDDVKVCSHDDVNVGSHGDVSVSIHGDVSVGSHSDVSVGSHGDAIVGSHGDASVGSHGDASVGSHGDVNVRSHGDASVGSHDDVDIGSHGDVGVSRHGDAVVDCSDIFIDVEGPPTIKDDALSSGFDRQQSSDYSGVREEINQHELYIDGETLLKPTVAHGDLRDNIAIQGDKEGESSGEDCLRNGKDAINRTENKTLPQDNQSDTADNNLYNSDHKVNNGNDREFIQYNGEVNSDINITKEPEVKGDNNTSKYGDDVSKESDVIILIDNVDGNDTNDSGQAWIGLNENDLKLRRKSSDSDSEHLRILKSTSPDHTITSEFFSGKVSPVGVPPRPSHDGGNELPLNERILNVNRSIDWVRSVIMEMRSQDLMLKIQFDGLREEIRNLKHEFEHYGVGCDYYNDEELSNIEVLNQKTVKSKSHLKANTAVREDSGYQSDASDPKDDGKGNVAKAKYLYEPIPSFPKVQTLPSNKCVFEFVL